MSEQFNKASKTLEDIANREPEVREENNKKLKKLFDDNRIKYVCINGNYDNRYQQSKQLIEKLLNKQEKRTLC